MSISGFALTSALLGQGRREEWIKGLCPSLGLSVSAADGFTTESASYFKKEEAGEWQCD
jgi:hypothetical protein